MVPKSLTTSCVISYHCWKLPAVTPTGLDLWWQLMGGHVLAHFFMLLISYIVTLTSLKSLGSEGWCKALSTCGSHFKVVKYSSLFLVYPPTCVLWPFTPQTIWWLCSLQSSLPCYLCSDKHIGEKCQEDFVEEKCYRLLMMPRKWRFIYIGRMILVNCERKFRNFEDNC